MRELPIRSPASYSRRILGYPASVQIGVFTARLARIVDAFLIGEGRRPAPPISMAHTAPLLRLEIDGWMSRLRSWPEFRSCHSKLERTCPECWAATLLHHLGSSPCGGCRGKWSQRKRRADSRRRSGVDEESRIGDRFGYPPLAWVGPSFCRHYFDALARYRCSEGWTASEKDGSNPISAGGVILTFW
jgi:hypothetical protein